MNKQLLNAYDQINLTISDLEVYWESYNCQLGLRRQSVMMARDLKARLEELMKLEGMTIPGE